MQDEARRIQAGIEKLVAEGAGPERIADAAVVGSALVNVIGTHGQSAALLDEVERYVRWLQN